MRGSPKEILDNNGIVPSKALGQNFLFDHNIVKKIVKLAGVDSHSNVLEIGPGLGALSRELAEHAKSIFAIEKDKRLFAYLESQDFGPKVKILCADALKIDLRQTIDENLSPEIATTSQEWMLIANLPYNIATPLVLEVLENAKFITKLVVMLQSEVADRFTAIPTTKSYGAVTVKLSYMAKVNRLMKVPPQVFFPIPKVTSSVVEIIRKNLESSEVEFNDWFFALVEEAFKTRRKMLKNSLLKLISDQDFDSAGIDSTNRAENLTYEDFFRLATVSFKNSKSRL